MARDPQKIERQEPRGRVSGGGALVLALLVSGFFGICGFVVARPIGVLATDPEPPVEFNRDIRPLLARRCLLCHGFDPSSREAGLRLDDRSVAIAPRGDGGAAIVPGDREASLLWGRITRTDADRMPPEDREALSGDEIELLGRWIDQGAPYDIPWAWQPVSEPVPPEVENQERVRDPLDRFVLARLESAGLAPAPPSSPRSWLRRVTYDLTGLPPTPEEIDAFLGDEVTGAHERVVDRLLDSPHFGERWGRHWLDLVRYAETHGHEFDYPIPDAWRYRDYVVRALNADVPYDQFVREHIAGDLIDPPRVHPVAGTNESVLGTGFWYLSQGTHGPVDVRQDQADRTDNQIDVLSKTFLGITVSCARCHDHKFDPILTADYYALAGFLRSSRRARTYLDPQGEISKAVGAIESQLPRSRQELLRRYSSAKSRPWARAARRAVWLRGETLAANTTLRRPDRVLFDFESESFEPWTVSGDAFGARPHRLDELVLDQRVGVHGQGVANSHDRRPGSGSIGSDLRTGRLTSPEFVIDGGRIRFSVGGGMHEKSTCVNLLVGGEVLRTMVGRNTTAMHEVEWDVTELSGSTAQIELVDEHAGSWGHIAADHFRIADADPSPIPTADVIAKESSGLELTPEEFGALLHLVGEESWVETGPAEDPDRVVFADFESNDGFDGWFTDGVAFGLAPVPRGEFLVTPEGFRVTDSGAADSRRFGPRAQGSLRSPSFTIEHDHVHLRVRGRQSQVRLIIDDYYLDTSNALLFEGLARTVDRDRWHLVRHDVGRYHGHRAYLEWNDEGEGFLAVDEVWFSNRPEGPSERPIEVVPADSEDDPDWLTDLARLDALLARGVPVLGPPGSTDEATPMIREVAGAMPVPLRALALTEGTPTEERVFVRGQHRTLGEAAPRRLVSSVVPNQPAIVKGSGRTVLADRVLDASNPLSWRVVVNRVWLHLLGRGIVPTPDDFGALGRPPTHPELLDHLAIGFRKDPSLQRLVKRIVLSETYRQSARSEDPRTGIVDPENELLHRRPPRRLDAEEIRDAILAISGRLDRTVGGPPIPVHLTEFQTGRGRPQSGPLDGEGRRSIYTSIRRNFLPPFLLAYDFPVPFSTVGLRSVSNVPAQGLARMNDPFVHEQAGIWAERIIAADLPDSGGRIDRMFVEAYGRPPGREERATLLEFLGPTPDREAWKDVAHALFASQEFIFLE